MVLNKIKRADQHGLATHEGKSSPLSTLLDCSLANLLHEVKMVDEDVDQGSSGDIIGKYIPSQFIEGNNIEYSVNQEEQQPPIEDTIASEDDVANYFEDHPEEFPDSVPLGDLKGMEGLKRKQMTIAELQEEVQRQKDERKLTYGEVLDKKSVKGEFNELVKTLLSGGYASSRTNNDAVNGLVANASTVYRAMKEDDWDAVCDVAYETARELVETMVIRDDTFIELVPGSPTMK